MFYKVANPCFMSKTLQYPHIVCGLFLEAYIVIIYYQRQNKSVSD